MYFVPRTRKRNVEYRVKDDVLFTTFHRVIKYAATSLTGRMGFRGYAVLDTFNVTKVLCRAPSSRVRGRGLGCH